MSTTNTAGTISDEVLRRINSLPAEQRARLRERVWEQGLSTGLPSLDRAGEAPASFTQRRMAFLHELDPHGAAYNSPVAHRLSGMLDDGALEGVLNQLLQRHGALRTVLPTREGTTVQQVLPHRHRPLRVVDLGHLPEEARLDEAERVALADAEAPFDLAAGPLVRFTLVRLADDDAILLLVFHHAVVDGWSLGVLMRELRELYGAHLEGRAPDLPAPTVDYAEYARWQHDWAAGAEATRQLDFWEHRLAGAPDPMLLPADFSRASAPTNRGGSTRFTVPAESLDELRRLSGRTSSTLFMVLLAAFQIVLARYGGDSDVVVGTPVANRRYRGFHDLVGFFANSVALRSQVRSESSFEEFLAEVRDTCLEAYDHQDVPLDLVAQRIHPDRQPGRNPVYQVNFTLHNTPLPAASALSEVALTPLEHLDHEGARFDLDLNVWETESGLECRLIHAADLFDAATARRLASSLQVLLTAVCADPAARVGDLPLMTTEETQEVLQTWNQTRTERPGDVRVHRLFSERARAAPDVVAVSAPHRGDLTYRDLDRLADGFAHRLRRLGAGPGTVVAVLLPRTPDVMIALLGILKSGAAYLTLDPAYPCARLDHMLRDSAATVLVADAAGQEYADATLLPVLSVSEAYEADEGPEVPGEPDDLMYVMYTSGSTGGPKGAMLSHRQVANYLLWSADTYLSPGGSGAPVHSSLAFDLTVTSLFAPLLGGRRVIFLDESGAPGEALRASAEAHEDLDFVKLTPSHLRLLEDSSAPGRSPAWTRTLVVGGEDLREERLAPWRANRGLRLVNEYGPTETAVACAAHLADVPAGAVDRVPIGAPIHNVQLHVLDEQLVPVPMGARGELHVGGAGVCHGYWNRPAATAERFVPDPFGQESGARLYRTGDMVRRRSGGELEYLGRMDDQVKIRGHRVEPAEVAAALIEDPAVCDAAVVVDARTPGLEELVAFVSPQTAGAAGEAREHDWIGKWKSLYEHTYSEEARAGAADPALAGWNSSYTGEPMEPTEMHEWLDHTVDRIQALRPRRILEIGCGTGMVLSNIASGADYYEGVDLSAKVIARLGEQVNALGVAAKTRLRADPAHRAVRAGETYDTVVLNSVVQYFPSLGYLFGVLEAVLEAVPAGGHVFLGDIRNLTLLEAFHASVAARRARTQTSDVALLAEVRWRVEAEDELCLDPRLFRDLPKRWPRITSVEVLAKRGAADNELTRYRYDVVLEIEGDGGPPNRRVVDWPEGGIDALDRMLAEEPSDRLAVRRVPHSRLSTDLDLLARLKGAGPGPAQDAPDLADLGRLAQRHSYAFELSWAQGHANGSFDLLLDRTRAPGAVGVDGGPARRGAVPRAGGTSMDVTWDVYANEPLWRSAALAELSAIEARLAERLPAPMLPVRTLVIRRMPLNANGKVERTALLGLSDASVSYREGTDGTVSEPGVDLTLTEERTAAIWCELLGRDRVRPEDDFFDLGGHSLLVFRLVFRLREEFDVAVPVRGPFEASTLSGLAALVDGLLAEQDRPAAPRLVAVDRTQPVRASYAQERLWFLHQLDPDTSQYNFPVYLRLTGELDADLLRRCLARIVERHEVLRTLIVPRDGRAFQTVMPAEPFAMAVHDLSEYPEEQRESQAARLAREHYEKVFDLAAGPALRVGLVRSSPTDHVLLLTMHHVTVDGWSAGLLVEELAELYSAGSEGRPPRLAELSVQYGDYAAWQRRLADAGHFDQLKDYWTGHLEGILDLAGLPLDRPRPDVPAHRGTGRHFRIPADTARRLRVLCREEDGTLFMALLSVLYAVLHQRTAQTDIVVGSDVANRSDTRVEPLIGFFVNQVVLRADLTGSPTWRELLRRTKALALEAYAHQEFPFEEVVKALSPPRTRNQSPLFQVKLVLNSSRQAAVDMAGLGVAPFLVDLINTSRFDITLVAEEDEHGIAAFLNYDSELFDDTTMQSLQAHYLDLAQQMALAPDVSVAAAWPAERSAPGPAPVPRAGRRRPLGGSGGLRGITPTKVTRTSGDAVTREPPDAGADLPLVLRPAHADVDLVAWATAEQAELKRELLRHGALLFRGFGVTEPALLESFASVFVDDLFGENGEHPRAALGGNVYTPVFFPPEEKLLWHNENSFNDEGPSLIWFCCTLPAESGGETPIVDSRAVHRRLDPTLREEFTAKGVMYIRNYGSGLGLDWRRVFQTDSRAEAEARCLKHGLEFVWHGDRLRTRTVRPAVVRHPRTGEHSWFNQAQHWHTACLGPEARSALLDAFAPDELPRTCRFGDGTPIPDDAMAEIIGVYADLEVSLPWERGDVMMLDNVLTAHARNPFCGRRELLVVMGGMTRYT